MSMSWSGSSMFNFGEIQGNHVTQLQLQPVYNQVIRVEQAFVGLIDSNGITTVLH